MIKSFLLPFLVLLMLGSSPILSQNLVSAEYIGTFSKEQLIDDFGIPFFQFGVDTYKVLYETDDIHGMLDTASGLMVIPDMLENTYPMLIYQHGTVGSRWDVPSNLQGGYQLAVIYAAMGYITVAADYLGLGEARGIHPYVHAESEAWAAIDLLLAAKEFVDENGLFVNDQLFITGYSQGGQAAMAAHRAVERDYAGELTVTAAAPMSGPYDLSGKMFEFTFGDDPYGTVAYLVSVSLSFHEAYGNIFTNDDYGSLFKDQYVPLVQQYANEEIDLFDLNSMLTDLLVAEVGAAIPKHMFKDEVLVDLFSNPEHPIILALEDNNTYDWVPKAPTRIYYCTQDEQVFYENATFTEMVMNANGAEDVFAKNSGAFTHGGCVSPSVFDAIIWFSDFQDITSDVEEISFNSSLTIYPNPSTGLINIELPSEDDWFVEVYDMLGRSVHIDQARNSNTYQSEVNLHPGTYLVTLTNGEIMLTGRVVVE